MKIHTIDLNFLNLEHSIAAFVVETKEGPVLIESGPASTLPRMQNGLAELGLKMEDIKHVFLSHIHFDHAGAAWAFAEKGANIYVHPVGLPHMASPEKLYNSARMIYGDEMDRLWGPMNPIPETQLIAPEHGDVIQVGELEFKAWYTPGHAVHHIAWELPSQGLVFCGDVAGVKIETGPVMPPCPPPDINVEDWLNSIDLLKNLKSQGLILTHFGAVSGKMEHLENLKKILVSWANWMKPYFEKQIPAEQIIPQFQEFVKTALEQQDVSEANIQRYEAANPAFMSVAGLLRYWKKRTDAISKSHN